MIFRTVLKGDLVVLQVVFRRFRREATSFVSEIVSPLLPESSKICDLRRCMQLSKATKHAHALKCIEGLGGSMRIVTCIYWIYRIRMTVPRL